MSGEAMVNAGIEVKVEDYDGTYVCLFCGESVRGQPALKCSHCSSNPFHVACVARADSKYAEVCPTCDRKTVEAWVSASGGAVAPSEIIDLRELESEGESAAEVAALTGNGARAEAVPAVGGTEVAADMVRRGDGAAGQAHAGSAQPEKQQGRECRKSSAGQRSQEEERAALNPARSTALEQAPLGGGQAPLRLSEAERCLFERSAPRRVECRLCVSGAGADAANGEFVLVKSAELQGAPRDIGPLVWRKETLKASGGDGQLCILWTCLLYTSPSPRDGLLSRMPSSA